MKIIFRWVSLKPIPINYLLVQIPIYLYVQNKHVGHP